MMIYNRILFSYLLFLQFLYHISCEPNENSFLIEKVRVSHLLNASVLFQPTPLTGPMVDRILDQFLYENILTKKAEFPLLCVTFLEGHDRYFSKLQAKITEATGTCHWAILVFRGFRHISAKFEKLIPTLNLKGNKIVLFEYSMNRLDLLDRFGTFHDRLFSNPMINHKQNVENAMRSHPFNPKFFPKPLLLTHLIPLAAKYEYVWIFDGDIHLTGFDIPRLYQNLHCAFDHPPMIAQPLIFENTQMYWYFNHESWMDKPNVIAHETKFIEVQTPIFNGLFLEFYLSKIVSRMLWPLHILGVDYGFDNTFCAMATSYAKRRELALYKLRNNVTYVDDVISELIMNQALTPCAVIVDGTPVHHYNEKLIDRDQTWAIRKFLCFQTIAAFNTSFPNHFTVGKGFPTREPYGNESSLIESKALRHHCKIPFGDMFT